MISHATIEKLNSLDLSTVIGHYLPLKKKGANYEACCPFHEEKSASFRVNVVKNMYKCFGCGKVGNNAITFVIEKTGLPFVEACQELAAAHNITIDYEQYDNDEHQKTAEQKADLYKINEEAARLYHKNLLDVAPDSEANKMIFDRWAGMTDHQGIIELVTQWQIGFAPDSWDFITKTINEKALNEPAELLGLIATKNSKTYDTYRNRLIFPIQDVKGRVIGLGGRALGDDKAKYINSADSPLYNKSTTLYGLFQAKNAIAKSGIAYLTEGYTDVISFHLAGITNTVATCGTALTLDQAKILKRFCSTIVIAFDGDKAGQEATIKAIEILLPLGFHVDVLKLPVQDDPDSYVRNFKNFAYARESFYDQLAAIKNDAILHKAALLLNGVDNPAARNNGFNDMARTLSLFDNSKKVMRADYGKKIAKQYNLDWSTFRQLIDDQLATKERKEDKQKKVRKNATVKISGNATEFPFFDVITYKNGNYKDLRINKVKFVNLLSHFGFTRFDVSETGDYNFVRLKENIIASVRKEEIIDFVESFLENDYNFQSNHIDEMVSPEDVKNKFYDSMHSYFSKDLFARMRLDQPIIINKDSQENTFFYYSNGFVTIDKTGWHLQAYDQMNGSVWQDQMLTRDFVDLSQTFSPTVDYQLENMGVFADFVYRLSGGYKSETTEDPEKKKEYVLRFYSLCTIIGYISHDFYECKLKAILLTDSTMSDESDGRTGKTLLGKLIGQIRSYCEINGKDFDAGDKNKFEAAKLGTQVLHLNDVKNKGRNKFDFEYVFNDVTEGYTVNAKYMQPFKNYSKIIISTNKTLHITGGSQRDRIIQFEVSDFFNEKHSPAQQYGHWLMLEWDASEWSNFDNFMCFCACLFHQRGIIEPSTINLEMRVLRDHTCQELIDFMADISHSLKEFKRPFDTYKMPESTALFGGSIDYTINTFEFDKKQLFNRFKEDFEDYKNANWFTQNIFTKWLKMYGKFVLGVDKPMQRRSSGKDLILFRNEN